MKKLLLVMTIALLGCHTGQTQQSGEINQPASTTPLTLRYADFRQVAARTIDGVVHIRTVQTRLTPL